MHETHRNAIFHNFYKVFHHLRFDWRSFNDAILLHPLLLLQWFDDTQLDT